MITERRKTTFTPEHIAAMHHHNHSLIDSDKVIVIACRRFQCERRAKRRGLD